jgi:hypothetical protein
MKIASIGAVCLALSAASTWAVPLSVRAPRFSAAFELGTLSRLTDAAGHAYVGGKATPVGLGIRRQGNGYFAETAGGATSLAAGGHARCDFLRFGDLPGATAGGDFEIDGATGDLTLTLHCQAPQKAVEGVQWTLGPVPLDMNVIVPGFDGVKMTAGSPAGSMGFEYPMGWEAQLVIIEGRGRGFYVWADDTEGRYKALHVNRKSDGWWLTFTTWNYAPFDNLDACRSVRWRVNVYEGDWRVPARRYREWAEKNLRPTKVQDQQPAWVKDIRCCVIMGLSLPTLEALTTRLDPKQTLLYLPDWRTAGYDRQYPTYDQVVAEFGPFVKRAHQLGFRVMPHCNYFGCDPLNPLYEKFAKYQVRDPWGNHDLQWWLWTDADPIIKFAYINPAHREWRELLIERMKKLVETYNVDAVHLDQTICIYNDNKGLVDGMSMLQGNIALHRELRAALPNLALSGEGLDEVTYRYESFCQRHAFGLDFVKGTWNRPYLRMAHPISSYLLRPYTIMYGYLGFCGPGDGQLYSAWNENYQHWGIIPTLRPDDAQTKSPTGFSRQFFDEVKLWQQERVDPDFDGPWPDDVFFPYKTARGDRVVRTADERLMWGEREISRTVTDVYETRLPGTIQGWPCYDRERIFGLNPDVWYPYFSNPRDMATFHVERIPAGFRPAAVSLFGGMAAIKTEESDKIVADLPALMNEATSGSAPFDGTPVEVHGPLSGEDGSQFVAQGDQIFAHPPWKATRKNPDTGVLEAGGTGISYARWKIQLPAAGKLWFISDVAMDRGAIGEGKTDGVLYGVTARQGAKKVHAEVLNATADPRPLELDLAPFAGGEVTLELTVDPGPKQDATFDWARWYRPRVEKALSVDGDISIVGGGKWALALSGTLADTPRVEGDTCTVKATFPGTVLLLAEAPAEARLPVDLAATPFKLAFVDYHGQVLDSPQYASAAPGEGIVGGVARKGLATHPPNQGQTIAAYPMVLPGQPAEFHCFVGLNEGSKSDGVDFIVEANGVEVSRQRMKPGAWREMSADLTPWAGKPVVVSLVTDSAGPFTFDWARWGEPLLRAK